MDSMIRSMEVGEVPCRLIGQGPGCSEPRDRGESAASALEIGDPIAFLENGGLGGMGPQIGEGLGRFSRALEENGTVHTQEKGCFGI